MCSHCQAGVDRRKAITHEGCKGCPLSGILVVPDDGYVGDESVIDLDEAMDLQLVSMKYRRQ